MSTLLILGASGHAKVVAETALSSGVASRIAFLDGGYDLVFLDPPYDHDLLPSVLPTCLRLLAPGGLLYTESDQPFVSEPLPEWLAGWQVVRSDRAGAVHFALLSKE